MYNLHIKYNVIDTKKDVLFMQLTNKREFDTCVIYTTVVSYKCFYDLFAKI